MQYGPRIAAVIIYLYAGQFLSRDRTAQALAELFGVPLSAGTVAGITARAAGKLDGFLERVRGEHRRQRVAGFDETGFRVAGRSLGALRPTGKYILFTVHARRGKDAMAALGCCRLSPGSPSMTPGTRMTPSAALITSCAARMPCGSSRRSPTARRTASGAGRPGHRRAHRDEAGPRGRPGRAPWTRPRWPGRSTATVRRPHRRAADRSPLRRADEKHHALARRLLDRQDDYLRFAATGGYQRTTTAPSATSG